MDTVTACHICREDLYENELQYKLQCLCNTIVHESCYKKAKDKSDTCGICSTSFSTSNEAGGEHKTAGSQKAVPGLAEAYRLLRIRREKEKQHKPDLAKALESLESASTLKCLPTATNEKFQKRIRQSYNKENPDSPMSPFVSGALVLLKEGDACYFGKLKKKN